MFLYVANLKLVLEQILLVGKFAIETENPLLFRRKGLYYQSTSGPLCGEAKSTHVNIDLILLMRVHLGDGRSWLVCFQFSLLHSKTPLARWWLRAFNFLRRHKIVMNPDVRFNMWHMSTTSADERASHLERCDLSWGSTKGRLVDGEPRVLRACLRETVLYRYCPFEFTVMVSWVGKVRQVRGAGGRGDDVMGSVPLTGRYS